MHRTQVRDQKYDIPLINPKSLKKKTQKYGKKWAIKVGNWIFYDITDVIMFPDQTK